MISYNDLTSEQQQAIDNWEKENNFSDTYDYADNFRYARQSNAEEVFQYDCLKEAGCCGFVDIELDVNNETLLFGFNYGH